MNSTILDLSADKKHSERYKNRLRNFAPKRFRRRLGNCGFRLKNNRRRSQRINIILKTNEKEGNLNEKKKTKRTSPSVAFLFSLLLLLLNGYSPLFLSPPTSGQPHMALECTAPTRRRSVYSSSFFFSSSDRLTKRLDNN